MKRLIAVFLLFALSLPALAVEDGQVMYVGGTLPNVKPGAVGKLDTMPASAIVFNHPDGSVSIPYAKIDAFEYSPKAAHDLGVLPVLGVVLFKQFQRRHFFRISYHDESGTAQVAVFEVAKQAPQTLLAVLQTRAPQGCKWYQYCERQKAEARGSR